MKSLQSFFSTQENNNFSKLQTAIQTGQTDAAIALLRQIPALLGQKNSLHRTPLHLAVEAKQVALVDFILKQIAALPANQAQACINAAEIDKKTPLHMALTQNAVEISGMLVAAGASLLHQDSSGQTPIHLAAHQGQHQLLEAWFKNKSHADCRQLLDCPDDSGKLPLHLAASQPNAEVIAVLIKYKARIDAVDQTGKTALHYAAIYNFDTVAHILLAHGADKTFVSKEGFTPGQYALHFGHEALGQFLQGQTIQQMQQDLQSNALMLRRMDDNLVEVVQRRMAQTKLTDSLGLFNINKPSANSSINASDQQNLQRKQRRALFKTYLAKIKDNHAPKNNKVSCFVSYAWGDEHAKQVKRLVSELRIAGLEIPFDLDHSAGKEPMPDFITNIHRVDFMVIVGTPLLFKKYHQWQLKDSARQPVVRAELREIRKRMLINEQEEAKAIPLLFEGTANESLPDFLQNAPRLENFAKGDYFNGVFELIRGLYNIPRSDKEFKQICKDFNAKLMEFNANLALPAEHKKNDFVKTGSMPMLK